MVDIRIGNGYDVHCLVKERKLYLGCVEIPHTHGLKGHSDADVLCHAICDAMLGACGLGDIGRHFPDNDPKFEGVSGEFLLKKTLSICMLNGFSVSNIDSVIVAQAPKLASYLDIMCERISKALEIPRESVNVKATTEERLGFTGRFEGISSHAVCIMKRNK